ncbi:hypothetical protein OF83DRAFT_1067227 [Amylostereum chailletii]|nr:hypothetical protein OF83DRAFT_1067227 [Amylostereum chailletii]
MSTSRAESQYSRRRSNTAQSVFRNPPAVPLKFGDSKVLTTWVHDPKDSPHVLFNHAAWPGIVEGDLLKLTVGGEGHPALLLVVPKEDTTNKPQLQISLPKPTAGAVDIRNNAEVILTKVDQAKHEASHVEFIFQDQYLGRNDMWRLGEQLVGQCLHVGQEISFIGASVAVVDAIYKDGEKIFSAHVTATTKPIFHSLSAKVTIFIQVCRELWEFSGDGERFNEKIVHSFLPELFARWKHAGANHTTTIVLISRVFYDHSEVDYAEGPLQQAEDNRWYKDFFKVITDLEVIHDWQPTLVSLKDSFWAFQRDILLTHHYHRTWLASAASAAPPEEVRLVGQISDAHDGPILEALNMALNPMETHYIDRSLSLTGSSTILITPGTGYYRVSKQLLRLTTTRMLDQGFCLDLVSLAKPPLHRTPIFSFQGVEPEVFKDEKVRRYGSRALDPLWGGDDNRGECVGHDKRTFWWEPFWVGISFWDKQMDMPMRQDSAERRKNTSSSGALLTSKFAPSWLFNPFRSGPSQPETSPVSAAGESSPAPPSPLRRTIEEAALRPIARSRSPQPVQRSRSPQPMPIRRPPPSSGRTKYDETVLTHRGSLPKHQASPMSASPRDDLEKRRSAALSNSYPYSVSSSPSVQPNPSSPQTNVSYNQASLARRWQHMFPQPVYKHDNHWRSMITPCCLPLTTEHFPAASELETSYDVFSYDFVVDPPETRSFLVRPPAVMSTNPEEVRKAWALVVMRGMIALRLAQGFQFVLRPSRARDLLDPEPSSLRRGTSFVSDDDMTPKPGGAAEALQVADPVYLSMSNEIHRISYTGEAIQVRRYVRRMPVAPPFEYKCLIWPKLGVGYTEYNTSFTSHGLENYGWNRLDMLVAGYEQQFNESLRYWRTRFIVIPTCEPAPLSVANDKLNEEEIRILGIEKLGEMFSRVRWQHPDDRGSAPSPPVRLLPTDLGPSAMLSDEHLLCQLDDIHAAGPLRKKMKSERDMSELASSLMAVAQAMREEDGVSIKEHRWHKQRYPESFIGSEFVNWMVREFRDVSTRDQATEWGSRLLERGLFEHCRGRHGFLDGHYFYQLKEEYMVVSTPRLGWFRSSRPLQMTSMTEEPLSRSPFPSSIPRSNPNRKRLILSQSMVIDIDPNKKSDQTECVILHHDIIHNPSTVFHFELHWIGTTARCIEDMLRTWTRTLERYGLTLVEAYVTPIADIASRNPFQSCFPLRLALTPPSVPDLAQRVPEGTPAEHFFEYALLRRHGFVLDIEAARHAPAGVDAAYSYRRAPFAHSQFVHRSGVAFVQVLADGGGFLFLTNRLMGAGRVGVGASGGGAKREMMMRPSGEAEKLRIVLQTFCMDKVALARFFEEELEALGPAPTAAMGGHAQQEEPPALSI